MNAKLSNITGEMNGAADCFGVAELMLAVTRQQVSSLLAIVLGH